MLAIDDQNAVRRSFDKRVKTALAIKNFVLRLLFLFSPAELRSNALYHKPDERREQQRKEDDWSGVVRGGEQYLRTRHNGYVLPAGVLHGLHNGVIAPDPLDRVRRQAQRGGGGWPDICQHIGDAQNRLHGLRGRERHDLFLLIH